MLSPPLEPNIAPHVVDLLAGARLAEQGQRRQQHAVFGSKLVSQKASLHGPRNADDGRDVMRFRRMAGDKLQQVGQTLGVGEHDERARVVGERGHLAREAFGVRRAGAAPGDGQIMHLDSGLREITLDAPERAHHRTDTISQHARDEGHTVAPGQVRRG